MAELTEWQKRRGILAPTPKPKPKKKAKVEKSGKEAG